MCSVSAAAASPVGVGACENPVRLNRRTTNTTSGEVSNAELLKRCGNRRESQCPSCAALYRGDAIAIIRSGLYGTDGKQRPATWVTLTAPGAAVFGATHSQRRQDGRIRPCKCGAHHLDGDTAIGTPLDPTAYRYDLAADFNAHASRLTSVTFQKLGRLLGRKLRVVRVVEFQARGLVHVHALVLGPITQRSLEVAIRGGKNLRTGRTIPAAISAGWSWGPECKADVITAGSGHKLGAYMTKVVRYAVKSAGDDLRCGHGHGNRMAAAGEHSATCAHPLPDCRSGDPFMHRRYFVAPAAGPAALAVEDVPYKSRTSRQACRKHQNARRGWGFRGHVLSASRSWGMTFTEARARRLGYNTGTAEHPDYLLVEWEVIGRGYGPNGLRLSDLTDSP